MMGVRFDSVFLSFQLAVTILLWSVVMESQQRCYFSVDPHNRIACETVDLSAFFFSS